jgi:putative transposase
MPEYRRIKTAGGTYFFTVNTNQRQPILTAEPFRQALRQGIQRARQTLPFKIEAWVLLPDHLHAIWTLPPNDSNFSSRWAIIKRQVSKDCMNQFYELEKMGDSRQSRHESGIWQRRFWEHQIRDDLDFKRLHMDYLHWNPVKHGYVQKAIDWPFSSFHRLLAKGIYSPDWGREAIDTADGDTYGE